MTTAEKISLVATMLDHSVSNDLITAYLDSAAEGILRKAYPFDSTQNVVPDKYARLQCDIAVYLINKRGAEGQLSHNENGVSRSYEASFIPTSMLRGVTPFCGVV